MINIEVVSFNKLSRFLNNLKNIFADKQTTTSHINDTTVHVTASDKAAWNDLLEVKDHVLVKSCTAGSEKVFKLTIDDQGNMRGVEVTDTQK